MCQGGAVVESSTSLVSFLTSTAVPHWKQDSVCLARTPNCMKKLSSPEHSVALVWAASHLPGTLWVTGHKGGGSVFTKVGECY